MRSMYFVATMLLALLSPALHAQQTGGATGDTIGHPPPLPGPPPLSEPSSTTKVTPDAAAPKPTDPATKGYIGAYAPDPVPPKPYFTGPLPQPVGGPGLNIADSDGVSTRTVKAVPCAASARETDGSTTCVGIPEQGGALGPRRHRR
jgi:hypothetical protein